MHGIKEGLVEVHDIGVFLIAKSDGDSFPEKRVD